MIKQVLSALCLLLTMVSVNQAQNIQIESIKDMFGKGNLLKLSGGFSANSVLNVGDEQARDPFAYYLNGNINLNIYGQVNLPFSFSLTNSGSSYKLPSSPNRLSLHPSYKWTTGHIGDVSMTFSPYTLSGHMFTGVGVEMNPDGWEIGAMYGRLLKAVEYDETQTSFLPTYKRMGPGFKVAKNSNKYKIGINIFNAKDDKSSLVIQPDSFGITPMENLAGSIQFLVKPVQFIEVGGEYGVSLLTTDLWAPEEERDGLVGIWSGSNVTSTSYHAIRLHMDYVSENSRLGIAYERIDPNYRTLGAYYFTNDIENITFNLYQAFLENKLNVTASVGYERDDLEKTKASTSSRVVGSFSVAAMFSERINANLSYTNFQTHTNVRSVFELLNQENQLDQLDTLNFVQLSQSANLNVNIITKQNEAQLHNLNTNISYQDAANKQGGVFQPGSVSDMMNFSTAYAVSFLKKGITVNGAVNVNNSKLFSGNTLAWGPTMGASSRFFKKKVMVSGSLSYNTISFEGERQNEVCMFRFNSSYSPWERHNITCAYTFQRRSFIQHPSKQSSLITAGYSYSF